MKTKEELLKEIRELYQEKYNIQLKINECHKQLDEIRMQEAGREYLQDQRLSIFAN